MLLLKGDPEADVLPDARVVEAMSKYRDDLIKAGVLLAAELLLESSTDAHVRFSGGRCVVDGSFTEARPLITGFFLIQVRSKEEAIEWARRSTVAYSLKPGEEGEVELRQVTEMTDL